LSDDVPAAVERQYERALALRTVAFDDTAMFEFQEAYRLTKAPQLLVDAALAAQGARHYLTGAALVRQLVPDLESRPFDAVPAAIWRIVYPFPYASMIRSSAARYGEDPMLLASLVRQESGFEPRIVSSAGAVGLAQLEPYTALKWSRKLRLWYSRRRLDDPSYNLRVGSAYFHALVGQFGNVEAALAAYNAGEVKVAAWLQDDRGDDGPAKFVESIPFSQTRHYVQVVLDGAVIYRRLYGASLASRAASRAVARGVAPARAAPVRGMRQKAKQTHSR
jgi:soluble lytic murein transglycosylase